ncbi:hypothetical protein RHGRI_007676 [Rhododendron griersonianum]|uniref:Uncharacterized protein n=1 Tax=Rhododendron griersonianum TaxID=479676 RepID=A0AAV6L0N5_9ERIC|nr:hypothetical protein RHGRI_007676 [Rhododendron griersonianum]
MCLKIFSQSQVFYPSLILLSFLLRSISRRRFCLMILLLHLHLLAHPFPSLHILFLLPMSPSQYPALLLLSFLHHLYLMTHHFITLLG